jgi:choline transporter-like protein 2/4/5
MGKEESDPDDIVEHAGYSDESAKELEQHKAINKLDVGKDFAGPRSERKCTDVLWLLIIIAHWIAVTWLGIIAFGWVESPAIGQGRPYILTNWIDHNGWICGKEGHGGAVESKPYLYYPNPTGSEWNVALSGPSLGKLPPSGYGFCVHKCPENNLELVYDYTSCEDGVCDSWAAYETFDFVSYCIPDGSAYLNIDTGMTDANGTAISERQDPELTDDALEESTGAVFKWFQELLSDLPFVCGFLYMRLLRVPGVLFTIVWGTILIVFLVMLALGALLYAQYESYARVDDDVVDAENDTYELASQILAYICWFCAALFFCAVCCMRRQIMLAMGVVKEAAKVVNSMMLIVMLPIVQGIGITIFLVVWFIYIVFIATAGEKNFIEKDSKGSFYNRGKNSFGMELPDKLPYHTFEVTENQESALWFMLFDLFWTMEFVEALGQIIVATAAATYYFTRDRSTIGNSTVVFAARHATWYHAGTAAFGSFIIAVIKIIKAILMYIQRKCENAIDATGDGPVQRMQKKIARVVFFCFQCCIWCLEKCMKFINKEAYIQTAIFGHPFCTAARKGFFLVLRNLRRVAALETIGGAIFFITKLMIAATCALVCYIWLGQAFTEETHSIVYPTLLVGLLAYNLGDIFVDVVDMVADTLLICFIADEEIYGKNSAECFAPEGLRKYINSHQSDAANPDMIATSSDQA